MPTINPFVKTSPFNNLEKAIAKVNPVMAQKMYKARTGTKTATQPSSGRIGLTETATPVTIAAPIVKEYTAAQTFQEHDNEVPVREYENYLGDKLARNIIETRAAEANLASESANIDTSAQYIVKGSNDPLSLLMNRGLNKDIVLPGSAVKNIYNKQLATVSTQSQDYQAQLQAEIERVSKLDKNILVSSHVGGLEFKYDTMADSREQIEKANTMNKAIPGLGEGYKALYGAWGSAVELGRGAYNLGVSAIDYILPGQGNNIRAVTESDMELGSGVFKQKMLGTYYNEKAVPSIWTEEGRDILGKLGTPGYLGAGAFEVGAFFVGGKVIEPIIGTGSKVVQFGSKKLFTTSFIRGTEETILEGGEKLIVPTSKGLIDYLPSAIKESKTFTNFEKWAVEGYKPGKALIEVPVQGGLKQVGGVSVQEFSYEVDKSAGRIFLSPSEQTEYASRLASQGTVGGSVTIRPLGRYSSKLTIAADKETFEEGLLGGIKGRTSTTLLKEDILGTELGTAKGGSQAYKITDLIQPIKDVGYKEVEHPFKEWMETGFSFKGKDYTGFGKQTTPLSEKAIWGLRKPGILSKESFTGFIEDVRASASELVTVVKPTSLFSKTTRLVSDVSINVPSDVFGRGLSLGASGLAFETLLTGRRSRHNEIEGIDFKELKINETDNLLINKTKFGFGETEHQDNRQLIDTVNKQHNSFFSDIFSISGQESILDTGQIQESLLKFDFKTDLINETKLETMSDNKFIFDFSTKGSTKTKIRPPPFIPKKNDELLVGRKKKMVSDVGYDVLVKERSMYHGKVSKPTRFIKVNKSPLSQRDALSLGGDITDNSPAISFKLHATKNKPTGLNKIVKPWEGIQNKFTKRGEVYIEKNDYRIDMPGEVKGISNLGSQTTKLKSLFGKSGSNLISKNLIGSSMLKNKRRKEKHVRYF